MGRTSLVAIRVFAIGMVFLVIGCNFEQKESGEAPISGMVPENGQRTSDTTPLFSWDPVDGAVSYEVQVTNNAAKMEGSTVITVVAAEYTPLTSLTNNQVHYWRVRAKNAEGTPTSWSAAQSLSVIWSMLGGLGPPSSADTTPTLSWNPVDKAASYEVQLTEDKKSVQSVTAISVEDAEYTPSKSLSNNTTYYWRVRALDSGGEATFWSAIQELTLSWDGVIRGLTPAGGTATADTSPALSWDAVTGAAKYEVQIADNLADLDSAAKHEVTAAVYTPSPPLADNSVYYWRVRALDAGGGADSWSTAQSLAVNSGWNTMSGLTPADGTATADTSPALSWDEVIGAAQYEVQIADDPADLDSAAKHKVTVEAYTPSPPLADNSVYYWRVRALDTGGITTPWSTARSLTVNSGWGMMSGLNPADGTTVVDTSLTLGWDAVIGAAKYEVQIAENLANLDSVTKNEVTVAEYTPSALTDNVVYHWRVRALDAGGGTTPWTAAQSFKFIKMLRNELYVEGGSFQMGGTNAQPVHEVTVDSFFMMSTEVTFAQYDDYYNDPNVSITNPDDSNWGRGTRPVINVNWYDTLHFANWLSVKDGLTPAYTINGTVVTWDQTANGWRLPTEAEWEYAARGGSLSRGFTYAGSNDPNSIGWYRGNASGKSHPVGTKDPNELGLYDMSGNLYEWCWDWFGNYGPDAQTNPMGPASGTKKVVRGGAIGWGAAEMGSAQRNRYDPTQTGTNNGFRLVRG